jgi:hypothetical protein
MLKSSFIKLNTAFHVLIIATKTKKDNSKAET